MSLEWLVYFEQVIQSLLNFCHLMSNLRSDVQMLHRHPNPHLPVRLDESCKLDVHNVVLLDLDTNTCSLKFEIRKDFCNVQSWCYYKWTLGEE